MSDRVNIFHCGSQYLDWKQANCARCRKNYDEPRHEWCCELEEAIDTAAWGDGTVEQRVWERIGSPGVRALTWECPEKEAANGL